MKIKDLIKTKRQCPKRLSTLYISDLDGTLLYPNGTLSDFSRQTLNELIEQGLQFTVASGRSVMSMRTILSGLRLELPVIELNGAFITDLYTGEHYTVNAIQHDVTEAILHQIRQFGCEPFISTFDGTADHLYYQHLLNDGMAWLLNNRTRAQDTRLAHSDDLLQSVQEQVVCFTIIGKGEKLAELAQIFRDIYADTVELHFYENQYSPGWHWLTVQDCQAEKGRAIQTLIGMNGLNPEEVVTFGDEVNDVKMLKSADRGIAVANAIPEIKTHANQIIGSNEEDSVVKFIVSDLKNDKRGSR